MYDCDLILLPYIAEVVASEDISDKVKELRFSALRQLRSQVMHYQELGYMDKLLHGITQKRSAMIMNATTKTEMERIMQPHAPRYDGNRFIPDEYSIPEEELIAWSQISLKGPLNSVGQKRFMELFKDLFPEESKTIQI